MRVFHVIDSLGRGGAETLLVNVARNFVQHENTIITLYDLNSFDAELENSNVKVISLGCKSPWDFPYAIYKLKKLIRDQKPSVIHAHLFHSSLISRVANTGHVSFFFTNHCLQSHEAFKKWYNRILEKITYKKKYTMISVSKEVEKDYSFFIKPNGKSVVLYNFANESFFSDKPSVYIPGSTLTCIAVGRNHPQKNYPFLISNFTDNEKVVLNLFGRDDKKRSLSNMVLPSNIHYHGISTDIAGELRKHKLFIMSSVYEGQPVSILEAMAAGLPLLLSDIAVLREVAGDSAVYFSLTDPNDLRNKLNQIFNGEIDINELARKAFDRASSIARPQIYLALLQKLYEGA